LLAFPAIFILLSHSLISTPSLFQNSWKFPISKRARQVRKWARRFTKKLNDFPGGDFRSSICTQFSSETPHKFCLASQQISPSQVDNDREISTRGRKSEVELQNK
jgi:hypothetical protein